MQEAGSLRLEWRLVERCLGRGEGRGAVLCLGRTHGPQSRPGSGRASWGNAAAAPGRRRGWARVLTTDTQASQQSGSAETGKGASGMDRGASLVTLPSLPQDPGFLHQQGACSSCSVSGDCSSVPPPPATAPVPLRNSRLFPPAVEDSAKPW